MIFSKKTNWQRKDKKLCKFEERLPIPKENLSNIHMVEVKSEDNLSQVPQEGGCYWIWTTEPINHSHHPHADRFPNVFDDGEVIYNGIAKEDIRGRIQKHLLGEVDEGMSAISVDLLLERYNGSHRKRAHALGRFKGPYINGVKITNHQILLRMHLSQAEINYVNNNNHQHYFRNGINIQEPKHSIYEFRIYFISGFKSYSYGDLIEKKWRELYGLPKLCSYQKGR